MERPESMHARKREQRAHTTFTHLHGDAQPKWIELVPASGTILCVGPSGRGHHPSFNRFVGWGAFFLWMDATATTVYARVRVVCLCVGVASF